MKHETYIKIVAIVTALIIIIVTCMIAVTHQHREMNNTNSTTVTNGDLYYSMEDNKTYFKADGSTELIEVNIIK
jgi:flagellar basal body-associated protein FliL